MIVTNIYDGDDGGDGGNGGDGDDGGDGGDGDDGGNGGDVFLPWLSSRDHSGRKQTPAMSFLFSCILYLSIDGWLGKFLRNGHILKGEGEEDAGKKIELHLPAQGGSDGG